jgi:MEMO1 family protein
VISSIRPPAVAGSFYPGDPSELRATVDALLAGAQAPVGPCPKALVVPHAGYVYSGAVAASAFARVAPYASQIERVVLLGPAHRVWVEGLVWPGAARLATPLGSIEVDLDTIARLPELSPDRGAHAREHCLEVELPFLQRVAPHAKLVPLVAGHASAEEVGEALEALWGGPETIIVISSDLSHFLPYSEGRAFDEHTAARILSLEPSLSGEEACGAVGINGLLWVAHRKPLRLELVDLRSSGDTAGGRDEVVGYGAFAAYEEAS